MKANHKATILTVSGYGISAVAPLVATATQFPIFVQKGTGATVSGAFLLVAIICALPLFLYMRKLNKLQNKETPKPNTPMVIWGVVLLACLALYQIIDELIIISACGMGGVLGQKILFLFAKRQTTTKKDDNTAEQLKNLLTEALYENNRP